MPVPATTGPVQVTALDSSGAPVVGYAGTLVFTSSDPSATLPAAYTFVPADSGLFGFSVTLYKAEPNVSLTATDTSVPSFNSTVN